MKDIIKLIRVHQWTKNFFMFAPLFFSGKFLSNPNLQELSIGIIVFCLIASSIYIFNDIMDLEKDKIHPDKKSRPIASGKINVSKAIVYFIVLIISGFTTAWLINPLFFIVLMVYFGINILYSSALKSLGLIDVFIVASGFVLRVAAGGVLAEIAVSQWLFIMTFLLALFIAFAKRREDVVILNETGSEMRKSIKEYNLDFISSTISILSATLIVSYLIYITSPEVSSRFEGKHPYISTLFVIIGVLRYLQITLVLGKSGSPSKVVLTDRFLQITILAWIAFFISIIYFI